MAQVVLENIYKSFQARKGTAGQGSSDAGESEGTVSSAHAVLRRINLMVRDGEFMVLVGPSGCGKSTLLRLIAGLEELTGGNIWVGDRLVNDLPPKERDIAMVFQNYALYPHLTVYDNIAFGLRRTHKREERVSDAEPSIPAWVEEWLVRVGRKFPAVMRYVSEREKVIDEQVRVVAQLLQIESLLERLPKQLSGGQKQRVALGRAIARQPQVFLMDEPLSNLDAKLRTETRAQIVQLQRQLGTTTIYVTHDQTEAMTMGDRIAVMDRGQIQQVGQPLELYTQPANRFVAEFMGTGSMNFLSVQFSSPLLIVHPLFRLTLPDLWLNALHRYDGRSLILGIRPEHFSLSPPATKNLPVTVNLVEALGSETLLSASLSDDSGVRLQVRVGPDRLIRIGEQLWLAIAPDKIHLFDPDTDLAIFPR
ncbi:MAG: ABC transporter ATP-binding protein [Actinomycetota bacterium]